MAEALFYKRMHGLKQTIYKWNQYNINTTYTYWWHRYNVVNSTTYKWNKWSIKQNFTRHIEDLGSTTFNPSSYHLEPYGNTGHSNGPFEVSYQTYLSDDYGFINGSSGTTALFYGSNKYDHEDQYIYYNKSKAALQTPGWVLDSDPYSTDLYYSTHYRVLNLYYNNSSNTYYIDAEFYCTKHVYVTYDGNGKGTTSYGQVTSTSSSAYPSNGASGSYWYESAGSTTTSSKGSTNYGYVTSSSRYTYPDDGEYNGYWYEYDYSPTSSQSQGSYVGEKFSTDRNAYPENGVSGSYWYVFAGEA